MKNLYEVLGVEPTATPDEIKSAYRAKAKKHHSDAGGSDELMKEINAAYEVLSDPDRRAKYDETGSAGDAAMSEAKRNLLNMFAGFVDSYAKGTNIIKRMKDSVRSNMQDFRNAIAANATAAERLRDCKARIVFKGDGPNLFAEIVQGKIDRLATSDAQLREALVTGEEMLVLLDPYSFREDQPTWDFSVPRIGRMPSRSLAGILSELAAGDIDPETMLPRARPPG